MAVEQNMIEGRHAVEGSKNNIYGKNCFLESLKPVLEERAGGGDNNINAKMARGK